MKRNFITLLLLCLFSQIYGQTFYDPYVGVVTLTPSSPYATITPPFVPVTGTATIILGSNPGGNSPIQWGADTHIPDGGGCTSSSCKLQVNISTTNPYTIITGTPSDGSWINKFTWFKSGNYLLIGTQKDSTSGGSIAVNTSGTIIVPIQHILPSKITDPVGQTHPCLVPGNNCTTGFTQGYNGIVVNIQPPSDPSVNNQPTANDNNGAYVYARTLLPVQILNLNSIDRMEKGIQLLWKTLNESNSKHFEIQRMYGGERNTWMAVGTLPASGNTQTEKYYKFLDQTFAKTEKIFYRIKEIDNDGTFKYTDIKSIQLKEYNKLQLNGYPNPVNETYHLNLNVKEDSDLSVELIDILGRSVSKESIQAKAGFNNHDIHFGGLSGGTYFIKVTGTEMNNSLTVVKID